MKKITLLPLIIMLFFFSCDTKKGSIIDSQKMINKRITGLADSLKAVSDSESYNRIKAAIIVEQHRFDSLTNELNNLKK